MTVPEVAEPCPDPYQVDACLPVRNASDASDGARPAATVDDRSVVHRRLLADVGAERLAVPAQDDPAAGGLVEDASCPYSEPALTPGEWERCTPDAAPFAEQSSGAAVLVALSA